MDELLVFLSTYGWQLSLIALAGIIILGVLKYCNVFSKFDEKIRHVLYLIISVGVSLIGSVIYLAFVHSLTVEFIFAVAAAIFALNQTFYSIYKNTTLKDLFIKIIDWIKGLLTGKKDNQETTENSSEKED